MMMVVFPPWYHALLYRLYRLWAWSPVVMRRGMRADLYGDLSEYRYHVHRALDELESNAEDGISFARSHLYSALQIGQ